MGWVIWHAEDDGRRLYVRRITAKFISFTLDPATARKWRTRAEAKAALKTTDRLTAYRVGDEADPDAPEPVKRGPGRPRKARPEDAGPILPPDPPFT